MPILIALYLGAIVAANLIIAELGALAVIPVGLALIGLNLVVRDRMHDRLASLGRAQLVAGMGLLIAAGGLVAYAISTATGVGPLAGQIAYASCVAFTAAALVDAVAYQLARRLDPATRSTVSNVPAAAVDSYVFLALAFPGPVMLTLVVAQFVAKALGGAAWAQVLYGRRPAATALPCHHMPASDDQLDDLVDDVVEDLLIRYEWDQLDAPERELVTDTVRATLDLLTVDRDELAGIRYVAR